MSVSTVDPTTKLKPFVISRDEMPTITHVEKEGELYHLGQLKDFRKVDSISDFMPERSRSSLSWVSLKVSVQTGGRLPLFVEIGF